MIQFPVLLAFSLGAGLAPSLVAESDLAPPLPGRQVEAGKLLSDGRWAEALGMLGNTADPEARFLRAIAEEGSGGCGEALRDLDGLAGWLPDLAGRIHAARGRCLALLGRHAEAAAAFAAVPPTALGIEAAMLGRARALVAAGRGGEGLVGLEPLLDLAPPDDPARPDPAAAALALAGAWRAQATPPDLAGARDALLRCWVEHPVAPEASGCLAALRGLPREAGAAPELALSVRRAEGLVDRGRSADAIAMLRPLTRAGPPPGPGNPIACRAHAALGRALRRERQNARAAELLRPVAERCVDPAVRTRAHYVLATAISALGLRDEAIALYLRFERGFPASSLADDALMAAADLLLSAGRTGEARGALQRVVDAHPGGDKADEARFRLAWQARREGDTDGAIAALQAIEEDRREVDAYEHARAAYWRAVLLSARGPDGRVAAAAIWRSLAAAPADYYALLSRSRLAGEVGVTLPEPLPPSAEPSPWPVDPGPLRDDPHFRAGLALLRLGLTRAAGEELLEVDRSRLPPGRGEPSPQVLLMARLLSRAGDLRGAHRLLRVEARALLRRFPDGAGRAVWELAYPRLCSRFVSSSAAAADVPPELLRALIREESALDPAAVSGAGAVGLTQLMLPTAQQVARGLKMPRPDRAALTDPQTSIRIGAAHLGQLLRRHGGSAPLALAAYNAGEGAVGRWRAGGRAADLDEWVEEIPYDETRGYVKRVMRSYASYRLLEKIPAVESCPVPADGPGLRGGR